MKKYEIADFIEEKMYNFPEVDGVGQAITTGEVYVTFDNGECYKITISRTNIPDGIE